MGLRETVSKLNELIEQGKDIEQTEIVEKVETPKTKEDLEKTEITVDIHFGLNNKVLNITIKELDNYLGNTVAIDALCNNELSKEEQNAILSEQVKAYAKKYVDAYYEEFEPIHILFINTGLNLRRVDKKIICGLTRLLLNATIITMLINILSLQDLVITKLVNFVIVGLFSYYFLISLLRAIDLYMQSKMEI